MADAIATTGITSGLLQQPACPPLHAGLTYRVGELRLQVDFSLHASHTVLFGPSGVGKSTLLRLLAGLLTPASGVISLGGNRLTDTAAGVNVPAGRRAIGYVTQEPALFPHLTVAGNIAFGLHALPRAERNARTDAVLAGFRLEPLAHRYPARLSGGERQRVALARALAPQPALLLLDEPFTGLDARLRDQTASALERYLEARPTTLLSVSHDVAEVYASAADVLLLEAGKITAHGPAGEVLGHHRERLLHRLRA